MPRDRLLHESVEWARAKSELSLGLARVDDSLLLIVAQPMGIHRHGRGRRYPTGDLQGGAYGGGVGLAAICDVAIAEDTTKFGLTETRLGLIPATISPYVIARTGEGKARRVFMSAKIFGAAEAKDLDLIADYLPAEALEARLEDEINPYLQVAPGAVAASKRLARKLGPAIDDAIIEYTISALADVWEGVDAAQGIDAFLSKTPPPWR